MLAFLHDLQDKINETITSDKENGELEIAVDNFDGDQCVRFGWVQLVKPLTFNWRALILVATSKHRITVT